jgi:nicotinate-nucleotide adenylyltransferase
VLERTRRAPIAASDAGRSATPGSAPGGRTRRVGILGGTFDPIHVGHLVVAQDAFETLELDELRLMVAAEPPHKEREEGCHAGAEARWRMVREAVAHDGRFTASRLEIERAGPSWTVDTLRTLREREPETAFTLLIGADQWARFDTWREPREIARLARLAVMNRGDRDPRQVNAPPGLEYHEVAVSRLEISSTRVRERLLSGLGVRYLVPEAVRRVIDDEGLYASSPEDC